jgi:uncharacterized membrane protein YphA (DoxX/SURF4 family)
MLFEWHVPRPRTNPEVRIARSAAAIHFPALNGSIIESHLVLNSIAVALPWFEVFCGLLLLAGIAVRGSALILLLMLIPFSLIVLHRALAIREASAIAFCAIQFDCGCGAGEVNICHKLWKTAS